MEYKEEERSKNLEAILQSHKLPDRYHTKLVDQGVGSIELLSQCTEKDVDELCHELQLNLVDKLKFKHALSSINIPRESIKYAVINRDEQNAILQIHQSIKQVENLIIDNNCNDCNELEIKLKTDKDKICSVFDSIHQIINHRKENILNSLEKNFENKKNQNQQLLAYLDEAKKTKLKCQQLILNKSYLIDIQNRNKSIMEYCNQCLSKLTKIIQLNTKINVKINNKNIESIKKCIDNLVIITDTINDEKKEKNPFSDSNNNKNDEIENVNTSNIKHDTFSNIKPVDVQWGYKQNKNEKKQQEFGSFEDGATFDLKALNKDKVSNKEKEKEKEKEAEKDDNCSSFTCKPVIELKEEIISSGHDNEELLQSFKIKALYNWGRDVTGQSTWKLRAAQTQLSFYTNTSITKTRLICREYKTSKLRLNHYVPAANIAKLNCKSDKLIIWIAAYDETIQQNHQNNAFSTFCAKFPDAQTASEFRQCFEKCQAYNSF